MMTCAAWIVCLIGGADAEWTSTHQPDIRAICGRRDVDVDFDMNFVFPIPSRIKQTKPVSKLLRDLFE